MAQPTANLVKKQEVNLETHWKGLDSSFVIYIYEDILIIDEAGSGRVFLQRGSKKTVSDILDISRYRVFCKNARLIENRMQKEVYKRFTEVEKVCSTLYKSMYAGVPSENKVKEVSTCLISSYLHEIKIYSQWICDDWNNFISNVFKVLAEGHARIKRRVVEGEDQRIRVDEKELGEIMYKIQILQRTGDLRNRDKVEQALSLLYGDEKKLDIETKLNILGNSKVSLIDERFKYDDVFDNKSEMMEDIMEELDMDRMENWGKEDIYEESNFPKKTEGFTGIVKEESLEMQERVRLYTHKSIDWSLIIEMMSPLLEPRLSAPSNSSIHITYDMKKEVDNTLTVLTLNYRVWYNSKNDSLTYHQHNSTNITRQKTINGVFGPGRESLNVDKVTTVLNSVYLWFGENTSQNYIRIDLTDNPQSSSKREERLEGVTHFLDSLYTFDSHGSLSVVLKDCASPALIISDGNVRVVNRLEDMFKPVKQGTGSSGKTARIEKPPKRGKRDIDDLVSVNRGYIMVVRTEELNVKSISESSLMHSYAIDHRSVKPLVHLKLPISSCRYLGCFRAGTENRLFTICVDEGYGYKVAGLMDGRIDLLLNGAEDKRIKAVARMLKLGEANSVILLNKRKAMLHLWHFGQREGYEREEKVLAVALYAFKPDV